MTFNSLKSDKDMSTNEQEFMEGGDSNRNLEPRQGSSDQLVESSLVTQMEEIITLMDTVHSRLQDCSIECQSQISEQQWEIMNSETLSMQPWNQSILSRTYFKNATLDEAFHNVLHQDKMFVNSLHNFVVLLRSEPSLMSDPKSQYDHDQYSKPTNSNGEKMHSLIDPFPLTTIDNHNSTGAGKKKRLSDIVTNKSLQQSFRNLMKAKLNFDTSFLTFDAEFNGESNICFDVSKCICKICSNTTMQQIKEHKTRKVTTSPRLKSQLRQVNRRNNKLLKSNRVSVRTRNKKISASVHDINNKSLTTTDKS